MLFEELEKINSRPRPFDFYTASDLWTDEYTSQQMLTFHLNQDIDVSSRNAKFIQESVNWITSYFGVSSDSAIADFGCGPGLYALELARRQAKVTGIDFSERSIRHARTIAIEKGLPVNYVHRNYLEFETDKRFDLVLMIMCDFCALSPAQRKTMLDKFASLLKPNGRILLDVYSLVVYFQRQEVAVYEENQLNGFWSPDKYYGFLNTFKYDKQKVVLDKYTIVERGRTRTFYNWLQYFDVETIKAEFSTSFLKIVDVFSNVAGKPFDHQSSEFAVVAERF